MDYMKIDSPQDFQTASEEMRDSSPDPVAFFRERGINLLEMAKWVQGLPIVAPASLVGAGLSMGLWIAEQQAKQAKEEQG